MYYLVEISYFEKEKGTSFSELSLGKSVGPYEIFL